MNSNNKGLLRKVVRKAAFDWIPIVFCDSLYKEHPRPDKTRHLAIKEKTEDMDLESLDFVITEYQKLLKSEDERRDESDSKASSLIGFTGITGGVIVAFGPFLLELGSIAPLLRYILIALYAAVGLSLIFSVILALRAIEVGRTAYMNPQPDNLLDLRNSNRNDICRQLAADLYRSYEHNRSLINDKMDFTGAAQAWLRNAVFCLFLLTFAFVAIGLTDSGGMEKPQEIIIVTPTALVNTRTIATPINIDTPKTLSTSTASEPPSSSSP